MRTRVGAALFTFVILAGVSGCSSRHDRLVNVSQSPGASLWPAIARSGGVLHIVWREDPPTTAAEPVIRYRRADLDSQLSPEAHTLGPSSLCLEDLDVAVSGDYVYVAFMHRTAANVCIVLVNGSSDGGQTFRSQPVQVSPSGQNARRVRIAARAESLAVAWVTNSGEAMLSWSGDAGGSFLPSPHMVAAAVEPLTPAAISWAADGLLIAYCTVARESFLTLWPPQGGSSGTAMLLNESGIASVCGHEHVQSFPRGPYPDRDYVAWVDRPALPSWVLRARYRADGQWSDPFPTAYSTDGVPRGTAISGRLNQLYAAVNSGYDVDFRRILELPPTGVAEGDLLRGCVLSGLEDLVMATAGDQVHIAFEDCGRIHYRRARYGLFGVGNAVISPVEFEDTPLQGQMLDMAIRENDHFIVFATAPPNQEVMLYSRRY